MKSNISYTNGIPLEDLKVGALYECRVSKRIVMVVAFEENAVRGKCAEGMAFNSVTGTTEYFYLAPNQLKLISE